MHVLAVKDSKQGYLKFMKLSHRYFLFPDPNNVLVFLDNHDLGRFMQKGESDLRRYKQAIAFFINNSRDSSDLLWDRDFNVWDKSRRRWYYPH